MVLVRKLSGLSAHFAKSAPFLIGRKVVEIGCGLLVFMVLTRMLPRDDFAIYSLVLSALGIIRSSSLPGIGNALAQSFARGHEGDYRRATLLSITTSMGGTAVLLGLAWGHYHVGDTATSVALLAAAVGFPPESGLRYWRNTMVGNSRFTRLLMLDSASFILRTVAIVTCAFLFPRQLFPIILAALLGPSTVHLAATLWQVSRIAPGASREPGALRYGVLVSLYEIPQLLTQQLDKLALFYFVAPEALAVYMVALRIPILLRAIIGEAIATMTPVFARRIDFGRDIQWFSWGLAALVLSGCIFLAVVVVPYLLPLLAGPNYNNAVLYAQILTVGAAAGTLGQVYFRFVKAQLDSRRFLQIILTCALIETPAIMLLTYYFGIHGAIAAFILKDVVNSAITGFVVHRHYSRVTAKAQ